MPALALLVAATAPAQNTPEPNGLASQAAAARQSGDLPRAIDLYRQAVQKNPAWPEGWWYLGQLHYAANDYAEAVDAFTHYLQLQPDARPATALRGLCEFALGDYEDSLRDVQRAVSLGAADDVRNGQILRYHQVMLLTRAGRFEEALTASQYFAKQDLSSPDLFIALGLAALRMPQLPSALDEAQREKCGAAGHAVYLLESRDLDAANSALQQFFARFPATPNLHYTWGYLLYPTDQDAAMAEFGRELAIDPQNAVAHTMLAWSLLMENDPTAALPEAKKAAAETPNLPLARLALGRALLETGDLHSALPVLKSASAADPNSLEAHLALARAYSEAGQAEEARKERLTCLQMTAATAKQTPAMGQQEEPPAR